jgi:hypothetical protein
MFDVKIGNNLCTIPVSELLDECNIIYTSEQLEKLKGLIKKSFQEEIFKIILPEEKPTENSEMSMSFLQDEFWTSAQRCVLPGSFPVDLLLWQ